MLVLKEATGVYIRSGAVRQPLVLWVLVDRVPGEIKRSRDLRGGRWSWTLTFAQKRS